MLLLHVYDFWISLKFESKKYYDFWILWCEHSGPEGCEAVNLEGKEDDLDSLRQSLKGYTDPLLLPREHPPRPLRDWTGIPSLRHLSPPALASPCAVSFWD